MATIDEAVKISATITAEVLLGKVRLGRMNEPPYLMRLREVMMQVKKTVEPSQFTVLIESGRPMAHAFAAALFDAVTEVQSPETAKMLKELNPMHRTVVEQMLIRALGKDREGSSPGRWVDWLWRLKQHLRRTCDLSISGLTLAEIRNGYDAFVHEVVDRLYDQKETLIS